MILSTQGLTKLYRRYPAVQDLSISVRRGTIYGLLGVNGAGKTSTIKMLTTLSRPSRGDAFICGHSIRSAKQMVRDSIGVLPQDALLPQNRTVLNVLSLYSKLKGEKDLSVAHDLLERLHMDSYAHRKIRELSHGQQRMVAIIQAFFGSPELIIMDEPLAGLDPSHRHLVREVIMSQKGKTTFLISTHLLEEVELICTDVGIIHKGKLRVQESTERLRSKENCLVLNIENLTKKMISAIEAVKGVEKVSVADNVMTVTTKGDLSTQILRKLITRKANISAFEKGLSTEDVFLESIAED